MSFREESFNTVVIVETWTRDGGQRALAALTAGVDGLIPMILTADTPNGVQLRRLFHVPEKNGPARARGAKGRVPSDDISHGTLSTPAILIADHDAACLQALKGLFALKLPHVEVDLAGSAEATLAQNHDRAY